MTANHDELPFFLWYKMAPRDLYRLPCHLLENLKYFNVWHLQDPNNESKQVTKRQSRWVEAAAFITASLRFKLRPATEQFTQNKKENSVIKYAGRSDSTGPHQNGPLTAHPAITIVCWSILNNISFKKREKINQLFSLGWFPLCDRITN